MQRDEVYNQEADREAEKKERAYTTREERNATIECRLTEPSSYMFASI